MAEILGKSRGGLDGIAEAGEKFNVTDAIDDSSLPMRRFGLAAAGLSCAYVAVESGGRGYSIELWVFEWTAAGWRGELRRGKNASFKLPRSVAELLAQIRM